jgi:hypothetical protein
MARYLICPQCDKRVLLPARPGRGAPRVYCSARCKQRASYERNNTERLQPDELPRRFLEDAHVPATQQQELMDILVAYEKYRRDYLSRRTIAGLAVAGAYGFKPGRPRTMSDEAINLIHELRDEGMTYRQIADELNKRNIPTAAGGYKWHPQIICNTVHKREPRWHDSSVRRAVNHTQNGEPE